MDDAGVVRGLERIADLLRNDKGLLNRHRLLRNPIGQRGSVDELQHERFRIARVLEAVDAADVGVAERREHLRFALETGEPIGIVREGVWQDLQRDVAAKLRVPGAIHLAHATLANRGQDFVRAHT